MTTVTTELDGRLEALGTVAPTLGEEIDFPDPMHTVTMGNPQVIYFLEDFCIPHSQLDPRLSKTGYILPPSEGIM